MNMEYTQTDLPAAVLEIITENYMNPNLNVTMAASLLNKNLDYVSKTFKKSTGYTILEYIQNYRMDKAKDYMEKQPELSVREISRLVGYEHCESFIRLFKRKQGMTPGRYKTMLMNN